MIRIAGPPGTPVGTEYTLTLGASDGVSGTTTDQVTITVVAITCSGGTVVPDPSDHPELVSDCEALLSARDALAGTANLNWSLDTALTTWDGGDGERHSEAGHGVGPAEEQSNPVFPISGVFMRFHPIGGGPKTTKMDKKHRSRRETNPLLARPEIDWHDIRPSSRLDCPLSLKTPNMGNT